MARRRTSGDRETLCHNGALRYLTMLALTVQHFHMMIWHGASISLKSSFVSAADQMIQTLVAVQRVSGRPYNDLSLSFAHADVVQAVEHVRTVLLAHHPAIAAASGNEKKAQKSSATNQKN